MGYLADQTEIQSYLEHYCQRCLHGEDQAGCAVWDAHQDYQGVEALRSVLDMLIPRDEQGQNLQCRLFALRPDSEDAPLSPPPSPPPVREEPDVLEHREIDVHGDITQSKPA